MCSLSVWGGHAISRQRRVHATTSFLGDVQRICKCVVHACNSLGCNLHGARTLHACMLVHFCGRSARLYRCVHAADEHVKRLEVRLALHHHGWPI